MFFHLMSLSERNVVIERELLLLDRFRCERWRSLQMLGDKEILESGGDLDGKIAIGRRDGLNVLALAVAAEFVAQERESFEDLIHKAASHGLRQVIQETLCPKLFDKAITIGMFKVREHRHHALETVACKEDRLSDIART
ncbi:hypothetical protein [Rhizobium gallicum]|uniref:hypothetical protein n=1 Tax=Rhizobium gallicum TaxID=56730 RepID=UPI001EF94306|nr:hypothetical protein [Rhizobium gallicum]ULJ75741.1 hypothetical protein L2W42_24705 [Rhizobium gallicum]